MIRASRPERVWLIDNGYEARWYRTPATLASAVSDGYLGTGGILTEYSLPGSPVPPRDLQGVLAQARDAVGPAPEMDWTGWQAGVAPTPAQLADSDRWDAAVAQWRKQLRAAYIDAIG